MHSISGTHPVVYCPLSYYEEGDFGAKGIVPSRKFWIAAWGEERPGAGWRLGRNYLWAWQYNGGVGLGREVGPLGFAGIPSQPDASIMNPDLARYLYKVREGKRGVKYQGNE